MIDLSRRGFLRGLAALAATSSIVPPAVALRPPPDPLKIWGDGIHDDTAALQALIDRQAAAGSNVFRFPAGTFRVTASIQLPQRPGVSTIVQGVAGPDGPLTKFRYDRPWRSDDFYLLEMTQ